MRKITASALTFGGAKFPELPKHAPMERAEAAKRAGFGSLGVFFRELDELPPKILRIIDVDVAEWADLGHAPLQPGKVRKAEDLGVKRIKAGSCYRTPFAKMAACLDALASSTSLQIAVEPVAWGSLQGLEDVRKVIEVIGSPPHVGIQLDVWQVRDELDQLDTGLPVTEIELSGLGSVHPAGYYASVRDAAMDRKRIMDSSPARIRRVLGMFPGAAVSYEMPREDWLGMDLADQAKLAAEDLAVLKSARWREPEEPWK